MPYRYKVTAFVAATVTIDERVFRFQQSLRTVQVPLRNIRRFGVQKRGKAFGGVVLSELLLLTEPRPGQKRLVRVPLDLDAEGGQEVLAALRRALPELDTTRMGWAEAAPLLELPVHSFRDALLHPLGVWGLTLVAASVAIFALERGLFPTSDPAALRTRGLVQLGVMAAGVVLLAVGFLRSRRS
jgi:hypothetical protein